MSFLRSLVKTFAPHSRWGCTGRQTAVRRHRARPSVTILEDRLAPALLTVNSLADGPISAASSALTLREAVALIDTGGAATDSSGNSLATAKASQINTASPFGVNDVIQFAPTLFGSAQQQIVLLDGSLLLDHNVTIDGPAASQLAVSGNNQSTVLEVAAGAAVSISGLTVEAGASSGHSGGGIVNDGVLTLTNTIVSGNTAVQGNGGGIANSGQLTLVNSTVSENEAVNDGGIISSGTLTLVNSTVSGNTAVEGNGGLANYGGALTLVNSTVSGNSALFAAGLGNYYDGTATLLNSAVVGNSARDGAGGISNTATLTLTDSTVSGNTAARGGGITNRGEITLVDSTVAGNTDDQGVGDGIVNRGEITLVDGTGSENVAVNDGGAVNTAATVLTGSVLSRDSIVNEDGSGETGVQALAGSTGLANSASGSANTGATPPNDGAITGEPAGVGNDNNAEGDVLTPIHNALPGLSADDRTVSSDSTSKGNSSAETNVPAAAGGAVSHSTSGDAREAEGKPSGRGQEPMALPGRVNHDWEGAASAMFAESNREDDWAERFVLLDREDFLDHGPGNPEEETTGYLVGLLLPWLSTGGGSLEEQSAQPRGLLERNEDRR